MTIDSPFKVRPLNDSDKEWLEAFTIEHWGAKEVVVHGTIFLPTTLPGFVAELGDLPMGVITYQIRQNDCELVTLNCVVKRQGIGTALIQIVEETAQKAGCRRITLVTTNDNLDAMRFYQRRGYRLSAIHYGAVTAARNVKPVIPVVGDYGITLQDEVVLEKQLIPPSDAASD
jgi:RimJ/RimL family protein N-acetyltransferase